MRQLQRSYYDMKHGISVSILWFKMHVLTRYSIGCISITMSILILKDPYSIAPGFKLSTPHLCLYTFLKGIGIKLMQIYLQAESDRYWM